MMGTINHLTNWTTFTIQNKDNESEATIRNSDPIVRMIAQIPGPSSQAETKVFYFNNGVVLHIPRGSWLVFFLSDIVGEL
jgi:hypothetical protein